MSAVSFSGSSIIVDAALVAESFGLPEKKLRSLMRAGTITSRSETGQGEDAGRTRLNFIFGNRVLRLIVDAEGNQIEPARIDFTAGNPPAVKQLKKTP